MDTITELGRIRATEALEDKSSNFRFFFKLAVEKASAKLAAQGYVASQVAEYLSRPGHMLDLLKFAEDLHMQAVDAVVAGRVAA